MNAGPTTLAQRQSGLGTAWLLPLVDGSPPIGWDEAAAYLTLPVLLVLAQYTSSYLTSPPISPKDENENTQRALLVGLPLMIGWFALNVPSGLSLYYLTNTLLSAAQQVYLKKLGGAKVTLNELGPVTKPGSGRRLGECGRHACLIYVPMVLVEMGNWMASGLKVQKLQFSIGACGRCPPSSNRDTIML